MTSDVRICNLALTRLGHSSIISRSDESRAGRLCALHYEPTRDAVLRAHPWNFAVRRAALPALSTPPGWGDLRAFQLPSDCLRVLTLEDPAVEFRIEGRAIVAAAGDPLKIEYVARIADAALFDSLFIDALSARLAAELAIPLTDDSEIARRMAALYEAKLNEARTMDAMEGTPRGLDADAWLLSRF